MVSPKKKPKSSRSTMIRCQRKYWRFRNRSKALHLKEITLKHDWTSPKLRKFNLANFAKQKMKK